MSSPLPVIVGFGGINAAGRMSFDHAYRRSVIDVVGTRASDDTFASLAGLMNVEADSTDAAVRQHILDNTLIRRIDCYDPDRVPWQRSARLSPAATGSVTFTLAARDLPDEIPPGWSMHRTGDGRVEVAADCLDVLVPDRRKSRVTSAGQVPRGFEPGKLYPSRNHPRGLQLNIYAASDAV